MPDQQHPTTGASIIVVSWQQFEEQGAARVWSQIDQLVADDIERDLDRMATARHNAPPAVARFLTEHRAALVDRHLRGQRHTGQGLIYIHDRLDVPPPNYAPGSTPAPGQEPTMIGGYQVVYVPPQQIGDRTTAAAVRRYSGINRLVIHCRVTDPTDPEHSDQPYIIVIDNSKRAGAEQATEQPNGKPSARSRAPEPST